MILKKEKRWAFNHANFSFSHFSSSYLPFLQNYESTKILSSSSKTIPFTERQAVPGFSPPSPTTTKEALAATANGSGHSTPR
jgi:hypothetical protein